MLSGWGLLFFTFCFSVEGLYEVAFTMCQCHDKWYWLLTTTYWMSLVYKQMHIPSRLY